MEQEGNNSGTDDKKTWSSNEHTENQTEAPSERQETPAEVISHEPTDTPAEVISGEPTEIPAEVISSEPMEIPAEGISSEGTNNSAVALDKPAELPKEEAKLSKPLVEASNNKPESSEKKTPKSLKPKSNIAKKHVAINGPNNNMNKGKPLAQQKRKKKIKKVLQNNKESGGSEQGLKVSDKGNKSDQSERKEEVINEAEKGQPKLEKGETSGVGKDKQVETVVNEEHTEKEKEMISESVKSGKKLKRNRCRGKNLSKCNENNVEAKDSGEKKSTPTVSKKEKLDGMIFMCSKKTKPDCFNYHVMGVTIGKKDTVMSIKRGMKLFLYDFDLKLLYGIYKATAGGGLNLEPNAFNGAFPAQVRFEVHKDCLPLPESVLKKAIKENYNEKQKFKTELTAPQVKKLMSLFRPAEKHSSVTKPPPPVAPATGKGERESLSLSARKGESSSGRENKARDPSRNGDLRTHRPRSRERVHDRGHREARREASPRKLYPSEKEYRTYGLRGERRNLSPPRIVDPPPRIIDPPRDTYRTDYERIPISRHSNLILRDPIPLHRETDVADPLYLSSRDRRHAYSLSDRRELLPLAPSDSSLDHHYAKDSYYSRYYGGSSIDPFLPPPRMEDMVPRWDDLLSRREDMVPRRDDLLSRREDMIPRRDDLLSRREDILLRRESILPDSPYSVSGRRESLLLDADRRREIERLDRLYSTYAPDPLPSYHRTYQSARHDSAYIPSSSRRSDASSYYR